MTRARRILVKVSSSVADLLRDHVTEGDPLGDARDLLSQALEDKTSLHAHVLQTRVDRIIRNIIRSFEGILLQEVESPVEKSTRALPVPF